MHGQHSARAHTATNFARVGGRIAIARGRSNRAHYMLYPDAPPFCFRVGTSSDCNWQVYADGVAPRHMDLLWDGFALWAEPLHGSAPVLLNGATHRHRVRITGNTRLSVGDAVIDILVGTEEAGAAAVQPVILCSRVEAPEHEFHVVRPPRPVDGDRAHLRTAVGVPVELAREAQYELQAIKQAALALAQSGRRDMKGPRLTHTQPIFAVDALQSKTDEPAVASIIPGPEGSAGAPASAKPSVADPARGELTEDVPYAHSEPPRASGIRPRVFSDAPPAVTAPYAPANPSRTTVRERPALERTQRHNTVTNAVVNTEARPRPPVRTVPPPRSFSAPAPQTQRAAIVSAPEAPRAINPPRPAGSVLGEVELRERYLRELARQRAANSQYPTSIFDPLPLPLPAPAPVPARRPQPSRASGLSLVIAMAIAIGLSPLTQPEVRDGLRARGAAVLQDPAIRKGSERVVRLLRALVFAQAPVPALPRADNSRR